jgi:hypothetical protein
LENSIASDSFAERRGGASQAAIASSRGLRAESWPLSSRRAQEMRTVFADTFYFLALVDLSDRKISEALTGDKHFEQAGFSALLL